MTSSTGPHPTPAHEARHTGPSAWFCCHEGVPIFQLHMTHATESPWKCASSRQPPGGSVQSLPSPSTALQGAAHFGYMLVSLLLSAFFTGRGGKLLEGDLVTRSGTMQTSDSDSWLKKGDGGCRYPQGGTVHPGFRGPPTARLHGASKKMDCKKSRTFYQ